MTGSRLTKAELARAAAVADANQRAAANIEQAGRGLHFIFDQVKSNASDLETVQNLAAVSSFVQDALLILLKCHVEDAAAPKIVLGS